MKAQKQWCTELIDSNHLIDSNRRPIYGKFEKKKSRFRWNLIVNNLLFEVLKYTCATWGLGTDLADRTVFLIISLFSILFWSNQAPIMVFFRWRSYLILGFEISLVTSHSLLCLILKYRHHSSSFIMILCSKHCLCPRVGRTICWEAVWSAFLCFLFWVKLFGKPL